jgi:hypothetical protein
LMFRLTPIVRTILILWASLWVLDFLLSLGDRTLLEYFALAPSALLDGAWSKMLGLLGYPFLHPTAALLPLLASCWMFAIFGPEIERLYPGQRFVLLLLKTTLVGAGFSLLMAWVAPNSFGWGSAMVLAASAAMYPDRRLNLILLQVRLLPLFLVLCGLDLLGFLAQWAGKDPNGGYALHLSGAAVGWLAVGGFQRFQGPWQRVFEKSRRKKEHKMREKQAGEEERLDRILAKISREGMQSLSNAEKRFLLQRSRDKDDS